MNDPKGYYQILEITDADNKLSSDDFKNLCKKHYRKLCLQYHPDKQQGKSEAEKKTAEDKFKKLAEAYDILSDDNKKAKYDQFGTADNIGPQFNPNDIFSQFFGGGNPFGDIFENFSCFGGFGGQRQSRNTQIVINGENIMKQVTINLQDAYNGKTIELPIIEYTICPDCHGNGGEYNTCNVCNGQGMQIHQMGFMTMQSTCPQCGGTGKILVKKCNHCHGSRYIEKNKVISVNIPAGVTNDITLRLSGLGKPGINGGQTGDILVHIQINEDTKFIRKNNDLYTVINIKYSDLLSNKELTLDVFGKKINFKIPIGQHILDDIVIKGKGFKYLNNNNYGDLHIGLQLPILNKVIDNELYKQLVEVENKIFK